MNRKVSLNYDVVRNSRVPETTIDFVNNCRVTIPPQYGGFVIPSGCGSGKTTAIVDMIIKMMDNGVLYSAATIDECNKMYKMLIDKQVTPDDIIVLHSDYTADGVDGNLMKRNDDMIRERKILICTHYKLLHEHNEVLYKFVSYDNLCSLTSTRSHMALVSPISTRQNIFIDEVPMCNSISIKLNRKNIDNLTFIKYEDKMDYVYKIDKSTGARVRVPKMIKCAVRHPNGDFVRMPIESIDDFKSIFKTLDCPEIHKEDSELNKLRNEILSDLVYDNMNSLMYSTRDCITLTRTIADMLYSDICCRIMLFEGTGDLTFYDSSLFKVLNTENILGTGGRYSSPISVRNPIPFSIKRSYKSQKEFIDTKPYRDQEWENVLRIISGICNSDEVNESGEIVPCTGTLIQTWKGYSIRDKDRSNEDSNYIIGDIELSNNSEFSLPDMVKVRLSELGVTKPVEVIHFMSGLDKATNQFSDFNRIIILGNLQVPNNVVYKFNQDYRVNTSPELFRTYQLSQLVCRTAIRKHNGDPIFIYYTSDIDKKVIDRLLSYLDNGLVEDIYSGNYMKVAPKFKIKTKWKPIIDLFCKLDYEFERCIYSGFPYNLDFTLDEIYKLIPMSRKERCKYNSLVSYLKTLGINLNIHLK
jgi:hypothetical protein